MGNVLDRPADPSMTSSQWIVPPPSSPRKACYASGTISKRRRSGRSPTLQRPQPPPAMRKRPFRPGDLARRPYLSTAPDHQGLILHSVYHRPNGWDSIPAGRKIPCGESSMWGDYHAREAALYVKRQIENEPYLVFWNVKKAEQAKPRLPIGAAGDKRADVESEGAT